MRRRPGSTSRTASSRRASSPASTARSTSRTTRATRSTRGYSYANAATGVFNSYTQASKYALPEWRYKNIEWYAQDNWKPSGRLTLDYGVRFYYLTPQWDTTLQASNFLPDEFDPTAAAKLFTPVCVGASPCADANRRGMDPALIAAGVDADAGQYRRSRASSAGSRPARIDSTARSRRARGSTTSCRTATPSGSRRASARSTT